MPRDESSLRLNAHLRNPLCSRHDHVMTYNKDGIKWKEEMDAGTQSLSSYHCEYQSCMVYYSLNEGYFTVEDAPVTPRFIPEPGINLYTCPKHGTWLYQSREDKELKKLTWRCGVDNCEYVHKGSARAGAVDHPNV